MTQHVLDNAVWFALNGPHQPFAEGDGAARRYHPDVSVFHGAIDNGSEPTMLASMPTSAETWWRRSPLTGR